MQLSSPTFSEHKPSGSGNMDVNTVQLLLALYAVQRKQQELREQFLQSSPLYGYLQTLSLMAPGFPLPMAPGFPLLASPDLNAFAAAPKASDDVAESTTLGDKLATSPAPGRGAAKATSLAADGRSPLESDENKKSDSSVAGSEVGTSKIDYTYEMFMESDGRSKLKGDDGVPRKQKPVGRYVCDKCDKSYATSSNLSRHKQTHKTLEAGENKRCPHCTKTYVSMPALSMHILTHNLRHKCHICAKAFSRPWLLQGHMRSHTGEKPYGCAHCGKAFADRSNLRAHMQTHNGEKQYKCEYCDKAFALRSYLSKHQEHSCRQTRAPMSADLLPNTPHADESDYESLEPGEIPAADNSPDLPDDAC